MHLKDALPDDHRTLLEHVSNIIEEELHDIDPARVQARLRLRAMLNRCAQTKEHDVAFVPYGRFRKTAP
jgi:hypothetical protein